MKVLAIDTSSIVATAAIIDEQKLVCEYVLNHKKTHSQKLMPIIKEILNASELSVKDIDLFAVAIGPGSFTGLRIGVATAKALAHSANKPIVGVPTLDALAYGIPYFKGIICPILDAKREQVYTAMYKWNNSRLERIGEYMALGIEELLEQLKEKKESIVFAGDGIFPFKETIFNVLGELANFAPKNCAMQRAVNTAQVGLEKYSLGQVDDYMTLSPFYLRKSQAERLLESNAT